MLELKGDEFCHNVWLVVLVLEKSIFNTWNKDRGISAKVLGLKATEASALHDREIREKLNLIEGRIGIRSDRFWYKSPY